MGQEIQPLNLEAFDIEMLEHRLELGHLTPAIVIDCTVNHCIGNAADSCGLNNCVGYA